MKTIKKGSYKRIHVNASLIRQRETGRKARKPIAVRTDDTVHHSGSVTINGPSRVIFSKRGLRGPYKAKVWIGTRSEVKYA